MLVVDITTTVGGSHSNKPSSHARSFFHTRSPLSRSLSLPVLPIFCPPLFDSQILAQQVFYLVKNRIDPFRDIKGVHFNEQNLTVETDQQIIVRLLTTL